MARTKKTPEELAAARAEKQRVREEQLQKQLAQEEKDRAEFIKNLPTLALKVLKAARDLRQLANEVGAPYNNDDYNWGDENSIDFDNLDIQYYLWGTLSIIMFDRLLTGYTKSDFDRFFSDFDELAESFKTKLEVKRAAEAEAARVRAIRTTAMGKLTDEEKKVLGVR